MTSTEQQDRAQYLSLALFSQKLISVLMDYVDENKRTKLEPYLDEALASLRNAHAQSVLSPRKVTALTSYEHLRTLQEVWSKKERSQAIRMIQAILRAPTDPKTKQVANRLIDLFSKLQNQALWNFEQPKPVSPKVMRRLCQLA